MARVPYEPFSTAQPISPGEQVREDVRPEAFGVNIGNAIQQLGATGEKVSSELFQRAYAIQELQDENAARDQSINSTQQMALEQKSFEALGERAGDPGVLEAHLQKLNQIRQQGRAALDNPLAQRYYDQDAASLLNRFTVIGAETAGNALKTSTVKTADAQMDLATKTWTDGSEAEFSQKLDAVKRAAATKAGAMGWDQTEEDAELLKQTSRMRFGQINFIAHEDSTKALDMLEQMKRDGSKDMTEDDWNRAYDIALDKNNTTGAKFLANQVIAEGGSIDSMEEKVRDRSASLARGGEQNEAVFRDNALTTLRTLYSHQNYVEQQQQQKYVQTVDDAINSGNFTSMDQLLADPDVAAAYHNLKPSEQGKIDEKLAVYWRDKDKAPNFLEYNRLRGEALDPATQGKFINEDIYKANINNDQRARLLLMREQLINGQAERDPQVLKAAAAIRNIYPNSVPQASSPAYHTFLGSLQGLLEDYQATKGAKASAEDYEKLGKVLMTQVPGTGWFSNYRVFEAPVSQEFKDRFKDMNDEEQTYAYHRQLGVQMFNKLFGAGGGGSSGQ